MVTQHDVSRTAACCGLLKELVAFTVGEMVRGRRLRPRLTFYTLNQWAAAFPPEENPDRVLGGYFVWYAQFRYILNLVLTTAGKPALVGPDGSPLGTPLVEVLQEPSENAGTDLVATLAPLTTWEGSSGLAMFGEPICVSVAVHPREGEPVAAAIVWNTGLDEPRAVMNAAERWARQAGAAEVFQGMDEGDTFARVELVSHPDGFSVGLPLVSPPAPKPGPERARPSNVIEFDDARRRLLTRRTGGG